MTTLEVPAAELQAQAREAYRRSLAEGQPLNRAQLGAMFDRKESWARDRITEVRREDGLAGDSDDVNEADTPDDTDTRPLPTVRRDLPTESFDSVGRTRPLPTVPPDEEFSSPAPVVEQPSAVVEDGPDMTPAPADMTPAVTQVTHHPGARLVAWLGFALGSLVSIAGNVLHAWLPADDMPPGWAPDIAQQAAGAVWSVFLIVAVEVLTRVKWHRAWYWTLARTAGVIAVAIGPAVISYKHVREVLTSWGYDALSASMGPAAIDGLMIVSGFALLTLSSANTRRNP